ncbi:Asp-tRNA(Asn)/Glu-tRNA(Gln) amidotransferase A subunit family amidase [Paraburkholderia youngii]
MLPDAFFKVRALLESYATTSTTPRDIVDTLIARIEASCRPEVWISRVSAADLANRAAALEDARARLGAAIFERMPLFGVPFAVKDNIDVAGIPTTAACDSFAYTPRASAFAVDRLLDAGAILIGKTNLDQFATGLVGTRSPYGGVRQFKSDAHISGDRALARRSLLRLGSLRSHSAPILLARGVFPRASTSSWASSQRQAS